MTDFQQLFEPLEIGTMRVPNRIAATTYSINAGRADGLPDAPFMAHHLPKARGGVGWIGNETWLLPSPLPPGRGDELLPGAIVLPHPSGRNNIWLKKNPWFDDEVIPALQSKVKELLTPS